VEITLSINWQEFDYEGYIWSKGN